MAQISEDQVREGTPIEESQTRVDMGPSARRARGGMTAGPQDVSLPPSGPLSTYSQGMSDVVTEESPAEFTSRVTPNPDDDIVGRIYVNGQALQVPVGLGARGLRFLGNKLLSSPAGQAGVRAAETAVAPTSQEAIAAREAIKLRAPTLTGMGVAGALGHGLGGIKGMISGVAMDALRQNAFPLAARAAPLVRGAMEQGVLSTPRAAALMSGIPNIYMVQE